MPRNNPYLVENKKPIELVQELKDEYKTPSFEEFMENYRESNLNYDDLKHGDIGDSKGYGPCHSCGNRNLRFRLQITLTK